MVVPSLLSNPGAELAQALAANYDMTQRQRVLGPLIQRQGPTPVPAPPPINPISVLPAAPAAPAAPGAAGAPQVAAAAPVMPMATTATATAPGAAPGGGLQKFTGLTNPFGEGAGGLTGLLSAGKSVLGGLQKFTGLTNPFGEGAGGLMDTLGLGSPLNWTPTTGGWGGIGDAALGGGEFGWGAPSAGGLLASSVPTAAAPYAGWAAGTEAALIHQMGQMGAAAAPTSLLGAAAPFAAMAAYGMFMHDKFKKPDSKLSQEAMGLYQEMNDGASVDEILSRAMFGAKTERGSVLRRMLNGVDIHNLDPNMHAQLAPLLEGAKGISPHDWQVADDMRIMQNNPDMLDEMGFSGRNPYAEMSDRGRELFGHLAPANPLGLANPVNRYQNRLMAQYQGDPGGQ